MTEQICLVPRLHGLGGPISFRAKLIQGFEKRGIKYTFDISDPRNQAILVNGGSRQLAALMRAKHRGVRIVQRLNGMNWLHKLEKTSLQAYFRSESANILLTCIRRFISHKIAYQSDFSQTWWESEHGQLNKPNQVIYNGIDLSEYSPLDSEKPPSDYFRVLLVEGHLSGAYARGLDTALQLAVQLQQRVKKPLELMVVGDVPESLRVTSQQKVPGLRITWSGVVPRTKIPAIDRSAHLLFSADLNAACPNSVIEALACGLPVLAYDTGALSELVRDGAGAVVPYGGNYWHLEAPDIPALAAAAVQMLNHNTKYRLAARKRAESTFNLDHMVESYLEMLLG